MTFWIGFVIGLACGGALGFILAGLCAISQQADAFAQAEEAFQHWREREWERINEHFAEAGHRGLEDIHED